MGLKFQRQTGYRLQAQRGSHPDVSALPLNFLRDALKFVCRWRAMEKLVEEGKTRNIGVSNFNIRRVRALQKSAKIPIAANQVELSLQNPQPELVDVGFSSFMSATVAHMDFLSGCNAMASLSKPTLL